MGKPVHHAVGHVQDRGAARGDDGGLGARGVVDGQALVGDQTQPRPAARHHAAAPGQVSTSACRCRQRGSRPEGSTGARRRQWRPRRAARRSPAPGERRRPPAQSSRSWLPCGPPPSDEAPRVAGPCVSGTAAARSGTGCCPRSRRRGRGRRRSRGGAPGAGRGSGARPARS